MDYYEYSDWIAWPESEVRAYAQEVAADQNLTQAEADYLVLRMTERAGYYVIPKLPIGPFKMNGDLEALYRSLGQNDAGVFEQNRRSNKPRRRFRFDREVVSQRVGAGLTRHRKEKVVWETPAHKRARVKEQRRFARIPFTSLNLEVRKICDDARWEANCLPIGYDKWLIRSGQEEPREGLLWYADQLLQAYCNARHQSDVGNPEAAMWHAFRTGTLMTELAMRLAHSETFDKYCAVSEAQRDAGRSTKKIPDEVRQNAYWRYRRDGNKRIEAGRMAAQELNLSEASIRNAFPHRRYPDD